MNTVQQKQKESPVMCTDTRFHAGMTHLLFSKILLGLCVSPEEGADIETLLSEIEQSQEFDVLSMFAMRHNTGTSFEESNQLKVITVQALPQNLGIHGHTKTMD